MSASLELAIHEHRDGLKAAGIEVNVSAHIMLPPGDVAIKLKRGGNSGYYSKVLRDAIQLVKEQKAAAIKAKQILLL